MEPDELRVRLMGEMDAVVPRAASKHTIVRRGKRIRRRRIFLTSLGVTVALICVALLQGAIGEFVDSERPSSRAATDGALPHARVPAAAIQAEDREVATFLLEALNGAGLRDITGDYYDYQGVSRRQDAWIGTFEGTGCTKPAPSSCNLQLGRGEIRVEADGSQLQVTDVSGSFTDAGRSSKIVGYRTEVPSAGARFVFENAHAVTEGAVRRVYASLMWTGAIPDSGEQVCRVSISDPSGQIIFQKGGIVRTPPETEGARDGIFFLNIPEDIDASNVQISCKE